MTTSKKNTIEYFVDGKVMQLLKRHGFDAYKANKLEWTVESRDIHNILPAAKGFTIVFNGFGQKYLTVVIDTIEIPDEPNRKWIRVNCKSVTLEAHDIGEYDD